MEPNQKQYDAIQCKTCGELDHICWDGDSGIHYCGECRAVENYKDVTVNENGEVLNEKIAD